MKGTIYPEVIKIVSIHSLNIGAPNFIKTNTTGHKRTDRSRYSYSGWFLIPDSHQIGRLYRQKNQQKNFRVKLHHRSHVLNKYLYPTGSEYTLFSAAHGTFSKVNHILGNKASINKIKN
jgi:hypothetical protein